MTKRPVGLLSKWGTGATAEHAGTNLDRLIPLIERVVAVAESAPALAVTERTEVMRAMHEELMRTIEYAREERIAVLGAITRERIEALQELQGMVAAERKTLTEDIGQLSFKIVDHAFWRAAQLVAVTLVFVAIGLLVLASMVLKRVGRSANRKAQNRTDPSPA